MKSNSVESEPLGYRSEIQRGVRLGGRISGIDNG